MKTLRFSGVLIALIGGAQLFSACSGYIVATGPPPPVYEVVTVAPSPVYIWVPGYYNYIGTQYVFVNGSYQIPPHGKTSYVQGQWQNTGKGYKRSKGRWN